MKRNRYNKWSVGASILVFLLIVYMLTPTVYAPEETDSGDPLNMELTLGTGEVCPIYVPTGEVHYNSEWTGALPQIDEVTNSFKTATFALG